MGNDGGSIPTRKDLVKERTKEVKVDNEIIAKSRASLCSLTKQPLKKPVVACKLGFLYNKEIVLKNLIDKNFPKGFEHITTLKDIVEVNVENNPKKDSVSPFVCPISQIEYNGMNKFLLVWGCGCMFSEKAFNETKDLQKGKCLQCGQPYKPGDLVSMNLSAAEQEKLKQDIIQKKEEKKAKKKKPINDTTEEIKEDITKKQILEPHVNILEKIDDPEFAKVKALEEKSATYKNLFHKEYKLENAVFTNVRHGIR